MATPEKTQLLNQTVALLQQLSAEKIELVLAFTGKLAKQDTGHDAAAPGSSLAFTQAEAREMVTPLPKPMTGKEIAEWGRKSGAIGSWREIDVDNKSKRL